MFFGNRVDIIPVREEKVDGIGGRGIIIDKHELIYI